jgi:polyisoprenyl-phosphate glycosyltransferase
MNHAFLSLVLVDPSTQSDLEPILHLLVDKLQQISSQFEIIVVENTLSDQKITSLLEISGSEAMKNLTVLCLSNRANFQTAAWAGLENSLGDFVCIFNPINDDIDQIETLFQQSAEGFDIVYGNDLNAPKASLSYRLLSYIFHSIYKGINGRSIEGQAGTFKVLSRRLISYIGQFSQPLIKFRYIDSNSNIAVKRIDYHASQNFNIDKKTILTGIDDGFNLLVSSTKIPIRIVTGLSLIGAISSVIYSVYVLIISLSDKEVTEGWASLSLQFSFSFFLMSCVLLILGEYILHMSRLSNEGPEYFISREFVSKISDKKDFLNIEQSD